MTLHHKSVRYDMRDVDLKILTRKYRVLAFLYIPVTLTNILSFICDKIEKFTIRHVLAVALFIHLLISFSVYAYL